MRRNHDNLFFPGPREGLPLQVMLVLLKKMVAVFGPRLSSEHRAEWTQQDPNAAKEHQFTVITALRLRESFLFISCMLQARVISAF
jgi:hypothetical protein